MVYVNISGQMQHASIGFGFLPLALQRNPRKNVKGMVDLPEQAERRGENQAGSPQTVRNDAADAMATHNALLVRVAEQRDRSAFASLFEHFAPRIKAYLMRTGTAPAAAEEVAQEAMVAIWRRASTFDPGRASASTWIFTIARNKRIDMVRREKRPELDPEDPSLVPAPETPADEAVAGTQAAASLREAIATLPPAQRQLLELAFFEDMSHSEIAETQSLPLGTVKSRIRLALVHLRSRVGEGLR